MNRYHSLLERLRPHIAPHRPEDVVRRVDVDKRGDLWVQIQHETSTRWLRIAEGRVGPVELGSESKLPLLAPEFAMQLARADVERPLAWYPGRRVVLASRDAGLATILKGYRRDRSAAAASRHQTAILALAGSPVRVPALVRHHREVDALEFERIDATDSQAGLFGSGEMFRVGLGLAHLQRFVVGKRALAVHDVAAEFAVLDEMARRVKLTTDQLPSTWQATRQALKTWSQSLPMPPAVLVHRDLHDRQVLLTDQRVWLIDFDLMALGDPLLDVGNLTAHLLLRSLQGFEPLTSEVAERSSAALLDGLDHFDQPAFWQRLRFWQAMSFLRLAAVYAMRPRWMSITPDLVHYADRCLEERSRV